MRKGITTIALIAALAASQAVISFAAISPGTGPVIGGGDSDYDIGERVDSVLGNQCGWNWRWPGSWGNNGYNKQQGTGCCGKYCT